MAKRTPGASARERVEHNPDDAFIGGVLQASNWAQQNRQLLTILGIALAVVIGGIWYWLSFQGSVERQAVGELERIQQTVGLGDADAARGELGSFLERFGGTAPAGEARLLLGQLHLEAGDAAQAIVVLEDAMGDLGEPVNLQSALLLAAAYETADRPEDAIQAFQRVASAASLPFQVREARMAAARLLEAQGNPAEAIRMYEQVLDDLDDDAPHRSLVEMRLAELRART